MVALKVRHSIQHRFIKKMLQDPQPPPTSLPLFEKQSFTVPLNQIVKSEQAKTQHRVGSETPNLEGGRSINKTVLQHHPRPRSTNLFVWCGAVLCLIFSLSLIFFGVATLVIYLVLRPRYPVFETTSAHLNTIYFDSLEYFNGDITFIANFTNPNQKIDLRFENVEIDLYFLDTLIGTQALQPFTQRPRETRLESVHFISSLVYLPQNLAMELQKQVQNDTINYNIRGTFKVKATLGMLHYSYWLHGKCDTEMSGPPNGILGARSCKTKR